MDTEKKVFKPLISEVGLDQRIDRLNYFMKESRNFPNNYQNIQMITETASEFIGDMIADRKRMLKEIDRLTAELAKKQE